MSTYSCSASPGEGWRVEYTDEDNGEVIDTRVITWAVKFFNEGAMAMPIVVKKSFGLTVTLTHKEMETADIYHPGDRSE